MIKFLKNKVNDFISWIKKIKDGIISFFVRNRREIESSLLDFATKIIEIRKKELAN